MNRSTAAAVAVAAVLGVVGGTAVATLTANTDDGQNAGPPSSSPSTPHKPTKRPSDTASPVIPAQLLYLDDTTIRDGYTHVEVDGIHPDRVEALVRIQSGWLVIERTSDEEPAFRGTIVRIDGEKTDLGDFFGVWDISEDGDRFVAWRGEEYAVTDLATGKDLDVTLPSPTDADSVADAAFSADAVLTGWADTFGRLTLRTDLATGSSRRIESGDLTTWIASPRGLLLAGEADTDSGGCLRGGALENRERWWSACDWSVGALRPRFSPDGEQLLVVPAGSDGDASAYGVLNSSSGTLLDTIHAPKRTYGAEWGDNNEVFLIAQLPKGKGQVIYRCSTSGSCDRERESRGPLVLGVGL